MSKMESFGSKEQELSAVERFQQIIDGTNPQFKLARIWGVYQKEEKYRESTSFISEKLGNSFYGHVKNISAIGDLGFVVTAERDQECAYTFAREGSVSDTFYSSFEEALLALLCERSGIREECASALVKMFK